MTELNSRYYGLSPQRTLTQGPYSVRYKWSWLYSGLKIVTDIVVDATKNSGLVAMLVTRFLYDLDLN